MMRFLTEDAKLVCQHENGIVSIEATQNLVTVNQRRLLVEDDPERRPISGCPNVSATIKPCQLTLAVEVGYSEWVRVEGQPICLETVTGLTDGTPPGVVKYEVRQPGQDLVRETG